MCSITQVSVRTAHLPISASPADIAATGCAAPHFTSATKRLLLLSLLPLLLPPTPDTKPQTPPTNLLEEQKKKDDSSQQCDNVTATNHKHGLPSAPPAPAPCFRLRRHPRPPHTRLTLDSNTHRTRTIPRKRHTTRRIPIAPTPPPPPRSTTSLRPAQRAHQKRRRPAPQPASARQKLQSWQQ